MKITQTLLIFSLFIIVFTNNGYAQTKCSFKNYTRNNNSLVIENNGGERLRLTPYGKAMIRLQFARNGQSFFSDNHYEMVQTHEWKGVLEIEETENYLKIAPSISKYYRLLITKDSLKVSFVINEQIVLSDKSGFFDKAKSDLQLSFTYDSTEHFTGLGHGYFAREESIDLRGKKVHRNYGSHHGEQAPLIVPFYLSSKGYGIFVNSTFTNTFNFGADNSYEIQLHSNGFDARMDYFFIAGPEFTQILNQYTQLTGRPRLPQRSMFGLMLSDKGHDHNSLTPSDEEWWKNKIAAHRNAGFPLDHIVNDNRWRAGGGKRCESFIEWDSIRYPDPKEYNNWVENNGLTMTLDFNRCIAQFSEGWKPDFNIPNTDSIDFKNSAPDLTKPEFRKWFWEVFWNKALNPSLGYPGDALWIDEFDEMGNAPRDMILGNGLSSAEMRNYWFFLIAKALVQEGWDKDIGVEKRPFVWVRGMTAGAQRYATLWSGDIKPSYIDMKTQIRGMQLAGLSGFPFWAHDAGGFYDWDKRSGPDDNMYRQWSMAFGSFSPIWKPHGMGHSRWPLDRSKEAQQDAHKYSDLRYSLMPYTYTYAHRAYATGIPLAKAMVINYTDQPEAWQYDLQYFWGDELLVAPNPSDNDSVEVWLPKGTWYNFWDDSKYNGNRIINYLGETGHLAMFVQEGSIIPMTPFALSTAFIDREHLTVHVYIGKDGKFTFYEDDGISERFRLENQFRTTNLYFIDKELKLLIEPTKGSFENANNARNYQIVFHGLGYYHCVIANGKRLTEKSPEKQNGFHWVSGKNLLIVTLSKQNMNEELSVVLEKCR